MLYRVQQVKILSAQHPMIPLYEEDAAFYNAYETDIIKDCRSAYSVCYKINWSQWFSLEMFSSEEIYLHIQEKQETLQEKSKTKHQNRCHDRLFYNI